MNILRYFFSLFFGLFNMFLLAQNPINLSEKNKIAFYKEKIKQKWSQNIDSAIFLANEAEKFCDSQNKKLEKITFTKMKGIGYYYLGKYNQADSIFHIGLNQSKKYHHNKLIGDYYNLLMLTKKRKSIYDSAIYYGNKNIAIRLQMKDSFNLAGAYDNLANVYMNLGDYNKAIELNTKSIDIFKQTNNVKDLANAYGNLSNLYGKIKNLPKSLEYLHKAMDIFKQTNDNYGMANINFNLGFYYFKQKKYDSAINYFQKSHQLFKQLNKLDALGDVNLSIGEVYLEKKLYHKAYSFLKKSEFFYDKAGMPDYKAEAETKLGLLFLKQKNKDSSQLYLKKARRLTNSQSLVFKKKLIQTEMDFYKTFGDYKNAFLKSFELSKLNDSIHTLNIQDAIHKELLQFKLDKMKSENIQLKQKQIIDKLHNRQMEITSIAMSGITFLSFVTLYLFFKKRKKEKEISLLKIKEAELKKQEMENTLQANERQLTGFTLHMMQKNLILKDLLDYIKNAEKNKMEDIIRKIKDFKIKLINALNSDQDWETFEIYFEKANPKFLQRLKEKHPDLTSKEIKLSTMIRLNMNIKETASTLNVEANSIRVARYRLRKKLGLSTDDNLYEYILSI